jgi:hypothetical protein
MWFGRGVKLAFILFCYIFVIFIFSGIRVFSYMPMMAVPCYYSLITIPLPPWLV